MQEFDDEPQDDTPIDLPPEFRDFQAKEREYTVSQLSDLYGRSRLNIQPEFQRDYVWDDKRASRFIESLLLNLPVPPIFVAENEDGSLEVIDGHQRLQSIFGFLRIAGGTSDRYVPSSFRALRLKGLQVRDGLNGFGIEELSLADRDLLMSRRLRLVAIPRKPEFADMRFTLFERLNQGSVPLNQQELRNCMYRGPYNDLIREIAGQARTLELFGRRTVSKRMKERELVLRFFALKHRRIQQRPPFSMFLNDEMEEHREASSDQIQEFRWEFGQAAEWTRRIFQQQSCCSFRIGNPSDPNGQWQRWNELVYECETVGLSEAAHDLIQITAKLGDDGDVFLLGLRQRLIDVLSGEAFSETTRDFPRSTDNTARRFGLWSTAISNALQSPEDVIDDYLNLRSALRATQLCNECVQPIGHIDDARIMPRTDRAVHRSCHRRWASGMQASTRAAIIGRESE